MDSGNLFYITHWRDEACHDPDWEYPIFRKMVILPITKSRSRWRTALGLRTNGIWDRPSPAPELEQSPNWIIQSVEREKTKPTEMYYTYKEPPWQRVAHDCWLFEIPGEDFVNA